MAMQTAVLPLLAIFFLCPLTEIEADCGDTAADIIFILDASGSVQRANFEKMKEFFKAMVDGFQIGYEKYSRPDVPKIAVIITDGQSNDKFATLSEAELLRNESVFIFSVGVGSGTDKSELEGMASNKSYVFDVSTFDALDSMREKLSETACEVMSCGHPGTLYNGYLNGSEFFQGKTVNYSCNEEYKLIGDSQRTCLSNKTWSGSLPTCIFFNTCGSNPCQNGATCTNGENKYTCDCPSGYSGVHCEEDIQPPLVQNCPAEIRHTSPSRHVDVFWKAPHFYDPFNNTVIVTTNYPDHGSTFLWGDYVARYHAFKPSNGLRANCTFNITVRPNPCPNVTIPRNGALVCNGWKREFTQFCVIFCQTGTILTSGHDFRTRYICGGSGQWLPTGNLPSCELSQVLPSTNDRPYYFKNCDRNDKVRMKKGYHWILKNSNFKFLCNNYGDLCKMENVDVQC
ncbi:sushi, von Willebrand factor type A, EGF and pentraxin domain-containing protein 1-like isoform X2 [Saccostrea cucullata]|uniref:sushi, von Willebrand factor type A, EGF and pentraxin domain-containing protein 1-like isoform X2 n=1 Tax=Saccostrea cuccullata TaxID=36930 RepID=UPI002ED2635E